MKTIIRAALAAAAFAAALQTTTAFAGAPANYINPASGNYNTASNWSTDPTVPNGAFDVTIDSATNNVVVTVSGISPSVESLTIGTGDTLAISNINSFTVTVGPVSNNGTIQLNSVGNLTDFIFAGNLALNGTGTLALSNNGQNRVYSNSGGTLTIAAQQTVRGSGQLGASITGFINNGTITGDQSNALLIQANASGLTNTNIVQATGSGITTIQSTTVTNTGGTIQSVGANATVNFNSSTIIGGTISGVGNIFASSSTLQNLTIAPGTTVRVANINNASLKGTITNNGTIQMQSVGNLTDLIIDGTVNLNGNGTVRMTNNSQNRIYSGNGGTLNIGASQTIAGSGQLGVGLLTVVNAGTITADQANKLSMVGTFTNNNLMQAASGGLLQFDGGTYNNASGNITSLAGGTVEFTASSAITGGTIGGAGTINVRNASFSNVTFAAGSAVTQINNTQTQVSNSITFNGSYTLASIGNLTDIVFTDGTSLGGTGTINLNNVNGSRIFGINDTARATIGAGLTIRGTGRLGEGQGSFTNNGTITGDSVNGLVITPTIGQAFINNGTLQSSNNGGLLTLSGGTFTNNSVIRANDQATTNLIGAVTVVGGSLTTAGTGIILVNAESTLDGTTITAGSLVRTQNINRAFAKNGLTLNGKWEFTSVGNPTDLLINGTQSFTGTGEISLSGNPQARIYGAVGDERLTIGSGLTIRGQGQVGVNLLNITNNGLISAQTANTLTINPVADLLNKNILEATNGGNLVLTDGTFTNTSATIRATAGGRVDINAGATIVGGTLSTTGGGTMFANTGTTLNAVTISTGTTVTQSNNDKVDVVNGITINGTYSMTSLGNPTDLKVVGSQTWGGTGTITWSNNTQNRIFGDNTATRVTIGSNLTISGSGQVGVNLISVTNQGTITAALANSLTLHPVSTGDFTNTGLLQAATGGTLLFGGNSFINTGGTIKSNAGGLVQIGGGTSIEGGLLTGVGSYEIRTAALKNVTIDAGTTVNQLNNFDVETRGTITVNGTYQMNSLGNPTDILVKEDTTIAGSGTVALGNNLQNRIRSDVPAKKLTINSGATVRGSGQIGFGEIGILNKGTVQADQANNLQILPDATNNFVNDTTGIVRATNATTLTLVNGGGTFTNNGTFEALQGSDIFMNAAAVLTNNLAGVLTGGTYRAVSGGTFANQTLRSSAVTTIAANTTVELNGIGSLIQFGSTGLESSLTTNNGTLKVLSNRNFFTGLAFTNNGITQLGGGTFNTTSITNNLSGEIFGFGTITPRPTNSGLIRSAGGTLILTNGIQGGSGTIQIDAGSTLDLSGGSSGSSADNLIHNGNTAGSLVLGSNNILVKKSYTNANFGSGNSFNKRANVAVGSGKIFADGDNATVIGGDLSAGAIDFGNVHVGSSTIKNYTLTNSATSGPDVLFVKQTSVNGGNITDARLAGSGVTAGNVGPLPINTPSAIQAVTFNATSVGTLTGQKVFIDTNFENVAGKLVDVKGAAYNLASASPIATPVALTNIHVGGSFAAKTISVSNDAPAGAFTEGLNASVGSTTGAATGTGTVTNLAAGALASTNISLNLGTADTSTAGTKSGTAQINFASNGSGTSGLGNTALPGEAQTVSVTGNVYRLASTLVSNPDINFGNVHVGDVVAPVAYQIKNNSANDGFSEKLNGSSSNVVSNGITITGSFNLLAPGSTSTAIVATLDTSTAGLKSASADLLTRSDGTDTSGLGVNELPNQSLTAQAQVTTANVYRLAQPSAHTPEPVIINAHVGAVAERTLSISNLAPNDGFSESLNASIGSATAGTTASGSFNLLAAQQTNNTSLKVGIDTTTAGARSGTASITLVSDGEGTSGLGQTPLAPQTVNISGGVYTIASAQIADVNLGRVHVGDVINATVNVKNSGPAGAFTELLNVAAGSTSGAVTGTTGSPVNLAGNASNSALKATFDTSSAGLGLTGSVALVLKSNADNTNGLGETALLGQTANFTADVVNYARGAITKDSGDGTLTGPANNLTLDFGTILPGQTVSASFSIGNIAVGPADTLSGETNFVPATGFTGSGVFPFADLAAGSSLSGYVLTFDSTALAAGLYTQTGTIHFFSNDGPYIYGDVAFTALVNIAGEAPIPEPASLSLLALGATALLARRRRN